MGAGGDRRPVAAAVVPGVAGALLVAAFGAGLGGTPGRQATVALALGLGAWGIASWAQRRAARATQQVLWTDGPCPDPAGHVMRSARLLMRPPACEDGPAFGATLDPVVCRWQGYTPKTVEQWKEVFALAMQLPESAGCPLWFAVEDREGDVRVAGLYFISLSPNEGTAELGWWLGPGSRDRGLGRASLPLVISYVHDHLRMPTVTMATSADNERAVAQILSTGAMLVRKGEHKLPNGELVAGLWFEHHTGP